MRQDLSLEEAQTLSQIILGDSEREIRLIAMLRSGRLVQALRTDTGPLFSFPASLPVPHPRALRSRDEAKGVDRIVTIDLDRAGGELQERLWAGVLDGSVRADPPWLPIVDLIHRTPGFLQDLLTRLLEDGVYALLLEPDDEDELPTVLCARVHARRVTALLGRRALDLDDPDPEPARLVAAIRYHVGPPRLLICARREAFERILVDPHPATELDRATIAGEIETPLLPARLGIALFLARVIGL